MSAIFISYRREDTEGQSGRLFDDLTERFGPGVVFLDVARLPPGYDFRPAIDKQISACAVVLVVIGKNWCDVKDETGQRRLDQPNDPVRYETAAALKRDIPVIPVLVGKAVIPRAEQLPADLTELAYRNAVELTHARWSSDVELLAKALQAYVGESPTPTSASTLESTFTRTSTPAPSVPSKKEKNRFPILIAAGVLVVIGGAGLYLIGNRSHHDAVSIAGNSATENGSTPTIAQATPAPSPAPAIAPAPAPAPATASNSAVSPPVVSVAATGTPGYTVTACGSIKDSQSGLEWFVGPDKDMTWFEAKQWSNDLQSCDGGWRLPALNELKTLFNKELTAGTGYYTSNKYWKAHIPPEFDAIGGGAWVWTKESINEEKARSINFNQNIGAEFSKSGAAYPTRAFAVK